MDINERAAKWPKETLQEIADLTKDCKGGIGRKIHLLKPTADEMETLTEIIDLTRDFRGGVGRKIYFLANHTLTHVTVVRVGGQAAASRNQ